jgi:hypothetical protein
MDDRNYPGALDILIENQYAYVDRVEPDDEDFYNGWTEDEADYHTDWRDEQMQDDECWWECDAEYE